MYNEYEIRPLPLSLASCRKRVEDFLAANDLRLEEVDYYAGVFKHGNEDEILAGGGLKGDVMKCVAVGATLRAEGFSSRLVSHLLSEASNAGYSSVKVFTKAENEHIFSDMGFKTMAVGGRAILMEYGDGLAKYKEYLKSQPLPQPLPRREGRLKQIPSSLSPHPSGGGREGASSPCGGTIVMNANPFTRGHRYLVEQASARCGRLYVIVVGEDCSQFTYAERLAMIRTGVSDLENVTVIEGSSYVVSSTTFPTYFLKTPDEGTDTQISLDLDLFARHIAPSLGVSVRFVGSEPIDALTRRYNERMKEELPAKGIRVVEVERLEGISASLVRHRLAEGDFAGAASLVPVSTVPYLLGWLATSALERELALTPKAGLVDRYDNGSHADMNFDLMERSIAALRPFFVEMARASMDDLDVARLQAIGLRAEEAMMQATGGVNTHRGALFALGLSVSAVSYLISKEGRLEESALRRLVAEVAAKIPAVDGTHGSVARSRHGVGGALSAAQSAWPQLFSDWLPFYREHKDDLYREHKTLLRIMATLDDTNVYYRGGEEAARLVKEGAQRLLERYSEYGMKRLNAEFVSMNISPGGSADMLALTVFYDSIVEQL
ncbi:MAG: triphosphoribosyl-dephospho-CoA synthase [Prevotella sp.]|nr:triphosphoribosyl-dephospho-CoA synthase [Prevotella sp.]